MYWVNMMSQPECPEGRVFDSPAFADDQTALLVSLSNDDTPYLCPGEELPINRAVHLARLRSYYKKCKACPHRLEAESFSVHAQKQLEEWWNQREEKGEHLQDGFGNQSPNEFTVQTGAALARTFAIMLWKRQFEQACRNGSDESPSVLPPEPAIVMGHDLSERSLEMMRESVLRVREQGCRIIDIGGVTPACMKFAVEYLKADGGIHVVSRQGNDFAVGIDLYDWQAVPLSSESLYEVQNHLRQSQTSRYSRNDGGLIPFPIRKVYLEHLKKLFQNSRPARIWLNTTNALVIDLLREIFQELPLQLVISPRPYQHQPGELLDLKQLHTFQDQFFEEDCDLGLILDRQGQSCHFLDDNFREIPAADIISLLYEQIKGDDTSHLNIPLVMFGEEVRAEAERWNSVPEERIRYRQSLREYFTRGMTTARTRLGYDAMNRYWFCDPSPVCDGIITLGKVLQATSGESGQ